MVLAEHGCDLSHTGAAHSQFDTQRPKFSVRWQPFDQELTLRGSYSEGFHAPSVVRDFACVSSELPGGYRSILRHFTPNQMQVEERQIGNPNLRPEVAYEWSYGLVYSPKWLKGLTVSADWWHIDMRSIASILGAQFIIEHEISSGNGGSGGTPAR